MDKKGWNDLTAIIRRFILAWLIAGAVMYLQLSKEQRKLDGVEGLKKMSFLQMLIVMGVVFCGLCLFSFYSKIHTERLERYGILTVFVILTIPALRVSFSVSFFCAVVLVSVILFMYAVCGWREECFEQSLRPHLYHSSKKSIIAVLVIGGFALLFFGFVSLWTVFRVFTYSAPTFDFGIFSQMFYQMKMTGLPNTTIERDGLLSHFHVHVSPVYYLLLPFYCLYPAPIVLQILQAAVLVSAVVPAWKLAQKHECTPFAAVLFCLSLFLYPAYSGGASYDLHENAFLTPLLFWLFYTIDCQKIWECMFLAVLTLMVKEDAAVYVAVIGLYLLVRSLLCKNIYRRYGMRMGMLLFLGAVIWFLCVTRYLVQYGDGVMTYRYRNFIYDDSSSLITMIKAVFLLPMKVLYECAEQEKLKFLALTILPLCGIPLITRKYERFLLLIPYVLVNLTSDYRYQHDIFFQYTYGSTACLFYLTIVNYEDFVLKVKNAFLKQMPFLVTVFISSVCFGMIVVPRAVGYPMRYWNQKEYFTGIGSMLQMIPGDASVTATTFYTVPLSNRDVLYDVQYSSIEHLLSTEYVVLGISDRGSYSRYATTDENGYENLIKLLEINGYQLFAEIEDIMAIYWKASE